MTKTENPLTIDGTTLDGRELADLRKLADCLDVLRLLDGTMTLQQAVTFLTIAQRQGHAIKDIAHAVSLGAPTVSRAIIGLGDGNPIKRITGLKLVETEPEPYDNRSKIVRLTPRGAMTVRSVLRALGKPQKHGEPAQGTEAP